MHPRPAGGSRHHYTLLISARNYGVDPQAYPKHLIERLSASWADANRAAHHAIKPESLQAA